MRKDNNTFLVFRASEKEEGEVWGSTRDLSLDTMVKSNRFAWVLRSQIPCQESRERKRYFDPWDSVSNSSNSSETFKVPKIEKINTLYWTQ